MKTGKELKISKFKNYNIVFGSVNNKHSKAVYINMSSWVEPKEDSQIIYSRVIRSIHKKLKQSVFNYLNNQNSSFLKDRTIIDLDIRESGIKYGKRSFMNCEVTLFLNSEIQLNSDIMKFSLNEIVESVIINTLEESRFFNYHKRKI